MIMGPLAGVTENREEGRLAESGLSVDLECFLFLMSADNDLLLVFSLLALLWL